MTDNARELLEDLKTLTNKVLLELVAENEDLEERLKNKGDLISRIEVESVLHNNLHALIDTDQLNQLYKDINRLHAYSSPEREKGEWIKIQSGDKDFPESIVCSKCKNENSHLDFDEHGEPIGKVFVTSRFCPNCGAYMRGGE